MMHKAWSSIEEVPYCFSRSYVKFQGHTALKIIEFDPNWAFPDSNSSLNSPLAMKCCTKLETAKERCPIVFQGHPSNFKVTRDKTSPILTQIRRFRIIGRSQLSNPSDLPCFCREYQYQNVSWGYRNTLKNKMPFTFIRHNFSQSISVSCNERECFLSGIPVSHLFVGDMKTKMPFAFIHHNFSPSISVSNNVTEVMPSNASHSSKGILHIVALLKSRQNLRAVEVILMWNGSKRREEQHQQIGGTGYFNRKHFISNSVIDFIGLKSSFDIQCWIFYLWKSSNKIQPWYCRHRHVIFSCDQAALQMVFSVRLSVCPSVCHTFFTMFPSSYHHEIFRSYYYGQKWCPCKRSRSEVKGQGHRGQHPT